METQSILLYEVPARKEQQIRRLAAGLGIEVHTVSPTDYLHPIGVLLGLPGFQREPRPLSQTPLGREMMLLNGFDDTTLSRFLNRYRQEGIEPIGLKAGVTLHNIFWDSLQLFNELKMEEQMFQKQS